ncbi:uncharacterized protein [Euwallacea fornicatus]|uniref:uncharacterized protein n=1 Tax=Euwallacea fornicatus TaxID=995702 RepID=UPI00338F2FE1
MTPDNENVVVKSTKPPPPVPPRPSKTLVKEALAKTRGLHNSSPTGSMNNDDKVKTSKPLPQRRLNQNSNVTLSHCQSLPLCLRSDKVENHSTRPVIYQSDNCKTRSHNISSQDVRKNGRKSADNLGKSMQVISVSKPKFKDDLSVKTVEDPSWRRTALRSRDDGERRQLSQRELYTDSTDNHDEAVSSSPLSQSPTNTISSKSDLSDKNWEEILNDKNHVNTLIDEMFASVLEVNLAPPVSLTSSLESIKEDDDHVVKIANHFDSDYNGTSKPSEDENLTVIVVNEPATKKQSLERDEIKKAAGDRKVKFNDRENHEFLIEELQNMKNCHDDDLKRQCVLPLDSNDMQVGDNIQINDWYGVNDGKKVKLSSCYIKVENTDSENGDRNDKIKELCQAYRLPPLPKALSGFKLYEPTEPAENGYMLDIEHSQSPDTGFKKKINGRQETKLDRQLAVLRREMESLRQQDLFLLSKLWFLSESIHDFRQMLQSQEEEKLNYESAPSPTPSSIEDDDYCLISTSNC